MKTILTAALVAVLCVAAGCARNEEIYSVSFRSVSGMELASGSISVEGPLPLVGLVRGRYKLQLNHVNPSTKEIAMFNELFNGKGSGRVEWTVGAPKSGTSSLFDFMPGFTDANIVARASPTGKGSWRGRWYYSASGGGHEGGGFSIALSMARK
jgi:hypothetical protein